MSVSNLERKIKYDGDGTSVAFNFTFKVFAESDMRVFLVDESVTPNVLTEQTINTDYMMTIDDNEGGVVTFFTAPPATLKVLLFRETSLEQGLEISTTTRFPAQQIENALDRVALRQIEISEDIERSISLSENAEGVDIALPLPEDGKQLQWDGTTGQLVNVDAVDADLLNQVATQASNVSTSAAAAAASAAAADMDATDAAASAASIIGDVALAQAAQTAAETAETNAAASATAAATSETNAGNSETAAGLSETNAAGSATAAATSATNAATSATNAATSETNAATSATNAATSETNAAGSATTAAGSATAAAASAVTASNAATGSIGLHNDVDLSTTLPVEGDVLVWDDTNGMFVPEAPASGGGGSTGVNIGDAGTYTIEGEAPVTTLTNFVMPRGSKSHTNWAGAADQQVWGIEELLPLPPANGGIFHVVRNSSLTSTLTFRNNQNPAGAQRMMFANNASFLLPPEHHAIFVLRDDNFWWLYSTSASEVTLTGDNIYSGDNRFPHVSLTSRQGIAIAGLPFINNSGTTYLNRTDRFLTNWFGTSDLNLLGFFRETTDAPYITGNSMILHIFRNSSPTASVTLVHNGGSVPNNVTIFKCPNSKDLVLPPQSQAILMLDGSNKWEVVSTSAPTPIPTEPGVIELNGEFKDDISGWLFATNNTSASTTATHDSSGLDDGSASLNIETSDSSLVSGSGAGDAADESVFSHLVTATQFDLDNGFIDVEFDFRMEGDIGATDKEFKVQLLNASGSTLFDEYIFGGDDNDGLYTIPGPVTEVDKNYKFKLRLATDSATTSYQIRFVISQARIF